MSAATQKSKHRPFSVPSGDFYPLNPCSIIRKRLDIYNPLYQWVWEWLNSVCVCVWFSGSRSCMSVDQDSFFSRQFFRLRSATRSANHSARVSINPAYLFHFWPIIAQLTVRVSVLRRRGKKIKGVIFIDVSGARSRHREACFTGKEKWTSEPFADLL